MTPFVVILICANAIPRDACTQDNARAYLRIKSESPICAESGAIWMAMLARGDGPSATEYPKIRCEQRVTAGAE